MKEILFYIFTLITLLAAIYIAFSVSSRNSIKAAMYLFAGIAGLLILLNFHLYSLFAIVLILLLFSGSILLRKIISQYLIEANGSLRVNIISIVIISILTAISAALLGAAKWPKFEILYDYNTLSLIFTKYLAAILVTGFLASVILSSALRILRNGEAK